MSMKNFIPLIGMAALLTACQSFPQPTPEVLTSERSTKLHQTTLLESLETMPDRTSLHWTDSESRTEGYAVPLGTYRLANGTFCRDYYTRATSDGVSELTHGSACRRDDGSWIVDRRL